MNQYFVIFASDEAVSQWGWKLEDSCTGGAVGWGLGPGAAFLRWPGVAVSAPRSTRHVAGVSALCCQLSLVIGWQKLRFFLSVSLRTLSE